MLNYHKYLYFLFFIFHLASFDAEAQKSFVLRGKVLDRENGEPLIGATIYDHQTENGVITGAGGSYQIKLKNVQNKISVSYMGFMTLDTLLQMDSDMRLDFHLQKTSFEGEEVVIINERNDDYVGSTTMSEIRFDNFEISRLPSLLGEADPIRFLQLTPGVSSGSEGGVGFYVRGGEADQNLVLYDNNVIFNPGHLMGFFSVFNPDVISNVTLLKSGIPARYGGRLSSVVNVESFRGESDSVEVKGDVGLISSRVTVNSSFPGDKGSFILSGRRSYIDLLVKPLLNPFLKKTSPFFSDSRYHFYDLNGGVSFKAGKKDFFRLSAYYGRDLYHMNKEDIHLDIHMNWGNSLASLNWNHVFNEFFSWRNYLSYTYYTYGLEGLQSDYSLDMFSSVRDISFKSYLLHSGKGHKLSFGMEMTYHIFTPNKTEVESGSLVADFVEFNNLYGIEGALFIEDEFDLNERLSIGAGLRYSFFNHTGPYTEYIRDQSNLISDTLRYPAGQSLAFYHHPEPRFSMKYQLNNSSSLKASYMRSAQYVHLATSSAVSLPTDIWLPSSENIQPQTGDQITFGYFSNLFDNHFESSFEIYYKKNRNQMEFLRGIINNSLNMTINENIAFGEGRSYGFEFFLRKRKGVTTGWLSYTLSRTERKLEKINEGKIYPAKYDRRHDISVSLMHELNEKWSFSSVFIFASGSAMTVPVGRYVLQGNLVNQYGEVNSFRMPAYHRLDLSLRREVRNERGNISTWNFSLYNVYSRANPFYIYFETTGNLEDYRLDVKPVLVSLFPVIPSVSYSFRF